MPATNQPYRLGVIGLGKIAQDQHLPVIAANPAFKLVAVSSMRGLKAGPDVAAFRDHADMIRAGGLDAVSICTPPLARHAIARDALAAGLHVMLEKPPAATTSELADLERLAAAAERVLFATWHSQHNSAVEAAQARLKDRTVTRLRIDWREDVRKWHPGQAWIWQPGGFGVFDPGINALSIATRIMPSPLFLRSSELVFPANRDQPIAANLVFDGPDHTAVFDWRQQGGEVWRIDIETEDGLAITLHDGGSRLEVDGAAAFDPARGLHSEYASIYARFATLLARRPERRRRGPAAAGRRRLPARPPGSDGRVPRLSSGGCPASPSRGSWPAR